MVKGFGKLSSAGHMGKSGEDVIRGSSNIPLSAQGKQQVAERAGQFAQRGGVDEIISSDLKRAHDSAKAVQKETDAPLSTTDALRPWHMGEIEGQPTSQVLDKIHNYILNKPDEKIPGRGPLSTEDGESFNDFKDRFLTFMQDMMAAHDGESKSLLMTHFRNIKLMQAWLKKGAGDDHEIDAKEMMRKDGEPGDVQRFAPVGARWRMLDEDMGQSAPLKPGIYLMRHGLTEWNGENAGQPGTTAFHKLRGK